MSRKTRISDNQVLSAHERDGQASEILELILTNIHTGIAYLDLSFNFVWVNQEYAGVAGRKVDYFRGKNYFDIFPDLKMEAVFHQVAESGGTYSSFNKPAHVPTNPGGETYWDWRVQAVRGPDQALRGLVVILENVTQRATVEQALQKAQRLFEHVFESDPDANILVDERGRIQAVNQQTETLFGYGRNELAGKPVETLLPHRFRKKHILNRQKYQADPHIRTMGAGLDLFGRRKDGSEFPVDVTLSPLNTENGLLVLSVVRDVTARKKAEEELRKSEQQLRAVTNGMPVILWAVDREGVFTLIRGRGLTGIRVTPESLIGKPAQEALKEYPEVLGYIRRALEGEEISVDLHTSSGEYFQSSYTPQYDENGELVGVIGLAFNITERKRAEQELIKSEERFRSSVENLLEAFVILTARRNERGVITDFVVDYANEVARRASETLGIQMTGRPLSDLLPQFKAHQLFDAFCRVVESGEPLLIKAMDFEDRWGGKRPFQAALDIQATRLGDGIATSWRNVTEDIRMAAVLRQQEALLRTVVDTLPVGVWVVDQAGEPILGNQAGTQIWGGNLERGMPEPQDLRAWWRRTGRQISARDWPVTRALSRGESLLEEEIEIETNDGLRKTVLISTASLKDETGRVTGAVMVSQEITERKRMEAELAEVQRRLVDSLEAERRRLAQELHDGPIQDLYGISFQLQGLQGEHLSQGGSEGIHEAQDAVQEVVQVLRDLCGELRPPALVHFGLRRAILSHIEKFHNDHPEIDIQLHLVDDRTELSEPIRLALFRIYQHTISNIVRHASASRVEIEFDMINQRAILEIRDNGVGFEVPRRWVKLAREGHLGLIGSVERAESVGGRLEIESKPGGGTTIRAEVPLPRNTAVSAIPTAETA